MITQPTVLYHYTCDHGYDQISRSDWWLEANPLAVFPLIWLTDLDQPDRDALGLTSHILDCDRTEHRLTVQNDGHVYHWTQWCRLKAIPRHQRDAIELADGAQPMRWWVTPDPIRCGS
jgi:hypothetical protein